MKVYYMAHEWKSATRIKDYLNGSYPKERGDELFVTDSPPDTAHIWASMEYHGINLERIYELDLPHSEAELAPYKCERQPVEGTYWNLPWYVVAGDPVKMLEASIDERIMGVPLADEQHTLGVTLTAGELKRAVGNSQNSPCGR